MFLARLYAQGTAKKRPKKDPNAPKGAKSAYMCYNAAVRPKIAAENPGMAVTEIAKIIGAKWNGLTDEEKVEYNQQAQEDKERYKRDMADYKPPEGFDASGASSSSPTKAKKKRVKKDPNAPKKPMQAYFLFSQDQRAKVKAENPDLGTKDIARQLGQMWKAMSEEDKKPYAAKAAEEKAKYERALAEYNAGKAGGGGGEEEAADKDEDGDVEMASSTVKAEDDGDGDGDAEGGDSEED